MWLRYETCNLGSFDLSNWVLSSSSYRNDVGFMSCRYSTFLFLYPIGISSEVGLIYFALPYIKVIQ